MSEPPSSPSSSHPSCVLFLLHKAAAALCAWLSRFPPLRSPPSPPQPPLNLLSPAPAPDTVSALSTRHPRHLQAPPPARPPPTPGPPARPAPSSPWGTGTIKHKAGAEWSCHRPCSQGHFKMDLLIRLNTYCEMESVLYGVR